MRDLSLNDSEGSGMSSSADNATKIHSKPTSVLESGEMDDRQRTKALAMTKAIWRSADAVCFDVDSTVCRDELIDELARFCGVFDQVCRVTKMAMNGGMSFRDALQQRLDLIRPGRMDIARYLHSRVAGGHCFTPGIRELVKSLHGRGVTVFLVSGGFTFAILPIAQILRIPAENVFANVIQFNEAGDYAGFDKSQPTSESGGKPAVCGMLKQKFRFKNLVMVGDGATDLEACPPADAFIGFGGNQVRSDVLKRSSWFVRSFAELESELIDSNDSDDE